MLMLELLESLNMSNPTANDAHKGCLPGVEIVHVFEHHRRTIRGQPFQEFFGIIDLYAARWDVPDLRSKMKNYSNSVLLSQIRRCKVFSGAKAGGVPFDPFGNARIGGQD